MRRSRSFSSLFLLPFGRRTAASPRRRDAGGASAEEGGTRGLNHSSSRAPGKHIYPLNSNGKARHLSRIWKFKHRTSARARLSRDPQCTTLCNLFSSLDDFKMTFCTRYYYNVSIIIFKGFSTGNRERRY